jgi:hypothetical protein
MIPSFPSTYHCRSHVHCATCRTDPAWRDQVGAPEICPDGFTAEKLPIRGVGDIVAKVATPIARALGMPCIDPATHQLKPESGCAKRKKALNKAFPFNEVKP